MDDLDFDQVEQLMDQQQQQQQGRGGEGGQQADNRAARRRDNPQYDDDVIITRRPSRQRYDEYKNGGDRDNTASYQKREGDDEYNDGSRRGSSQRMADRTSRDDGHHHHHHSRSSHRRYNDYDAQQASSSNRRHHDDDRRREEQESEHHRHHHQSGAGGGDERTRMVQQAHRDDCTVMVMGIHPKCTEREVYVFMSQNAGKVRDVQVIRDPRTNRSKGVAYVEFYTPDSILKALACNGQALMGHPIRIQASQAEKNRAAEAARVVQNQQQDLPMRVYVGGLTGVLIYLQESEIRKLFSPFGDIQAIEIAKSPYTGRPRGFAFVIYSRACDARVAIAAMHKYRIADSTLEVGYLASAVNTALLSQTMDNNNNNNNNNNNIPTQQQQQQEGGSGGGGRMMPPLPPHGVVPMY